MISRNVIRQSMKIFAPAMFLLICCSIGAFAQSPVETQETVEVSYKDVGLKTTISVIGTKLNLNVVFDDSVKDERLTLDLKNVTAKQVLKILLIQKRLQARTIEENTIIVFPDNETNRQRYGQYELWPAKSDTTK